MTDDEQLAILRARPNWPRRQLDALAANAAALGRLRTAVEEADRQIDERMVGSSSSSATIPVAQVPISDFSHFDNRSNVWYYHLWLELHRALRLNVPLSDWEAGD